MRESNRALQVFLSWRIGFRRVPASRPRRPGYGVTGYTFPPKKHRTFTTQFAPLSYCLTTDMKRAFVLRLTPEARPVGGTFQGRVEEVDSGRNVKFVAIEEFLNFLQQCLDHQETADK